MKAEVELEAWWKREPKWNKNILETEHNMEAK